MAQDQDRDLDPAGLIELIDRLEGLLRGSSLTEIEVVADGTAIVLRTPAATAGTMPLPPTAPLAPGAAVAEPAAPAAQESVAKPAVVAPLTGLFYGAPSPGAEPYVRVGADVHVGQVIGLIEAMKLFNEIKSDIAGRVARICVEDGALVKAKQPLIEVEPA